ncbi:hypothetical protein FNPHOIGM_00007 [Dickeya phage DchS19]|uniref:Tail assembly protein n=1 Tax=Dickeya phage DchS19 TaxID=2951194 RepID=A0A9E7LVN7_9CAUD|nr:hypothetical protein FNPHOIGM_00007 [Dickeya phage DchS19]
MGFFKKVKKAVSKVVKQATKAPENLVKGAAALATGQGGETTVIEKETPATQVAAPAPATQVETPTVETDDENTSDTESDKKKARAGGKKSLSIARSSGNGINI